MKIIFQVIFFLLVLSIGLNSTSIASAYNQGNLSNFLPISLTLHYDALKSNIEDANDQRDYEKSKYGDSYQNNRCSEDYPFYWVSDGKCHIIPEKGSKVCPEDYPFYWVSDGKCHIIEEDNETRYCINENYPYYWPSDGKCRMVPECPEGDVYSRDGKLVCENSPKHNPEPKLEESKIKECGEGTQLVDGVCIVVDQPKEGGGCLIATATYGSELAPQVQQLREIRDKKLTQTQLGYTFITNFNDFYYSFSPTIADYERKNPYFKEVVKLAVTPMIVSLSILNQVDIETEEEVLGYGISLILLNVGIYVGSPITVFVGIKKTIQKCQ